MSPDPAAPVEPVKITLPPSAYGVGEDVNAKPRPDMPGHLLFVPKMDHVPQDQEIARQELERVAAVLRSVFQERYPDLFRSYFQRLLVVCWGVFLPAGFHAGGLSDLANFKNEIVQLAGGLIKADYNRKLATAVLKAICGIVLVTVVLQLAITGFRSYPVESGGFWARFGNGMRWDHSISVLHLGSLLAVSMVGLLFASMARNLDPTFETLMTPDADLMQPWVRLLFFGIAIFIIALLFQLKVVTVQFGNSFSTAQISEDFLTAILIGLLLGLGERALPSQVERWSKDLVNAARRGD